MEFTEFAVERTTALSDLVLAIMTLFIALYIYRIGQNNDRTKAMIWSLAFGLMGLASILGAIAHGFVMTYRTNWFLWQPLNFSLGITIALFMIGVIYDLRGFRVSKSLTLTLLIIGSLFYSVTLIFQNLFMIFIIYEAIAMIFSLVVYAVLAVRKELTGAVWMAAGILTTLIASAVQASGPFQWLFIWEFDHNGAFHVIQMIGLFFLLLGLRKELLSRTT